MRQARTIAAMAASFATDRAQLMQVGCVASATGRSREDVERSLMVGDIVGLQAHVARNVDRSFRAELHGTTGLSTPRLASGPATRSRS